MVFKRFRDLEIGTCFVCVKGKFKKIKSGPDRYDGNAIGIVIPRKVNIQGSTVCKVLEEVK